MDLKFFGISDIVIVLMFLLFLLIGYKKGFLEKFISIANSVCGLLFSALFCRQFSKFLVEKNIIYPLLLTKVKNNVASSEALENPNATAADILSEIGFPKNLSEFIANNVDINTTDVVTGVSEQITKVLMVVVAFLLLFFGTTILCFILKIVVNALRASKVIRAFDGILGIIFYGLMYFLILYVVLFVISLVIQMPQLTSFKNFLEVDMQLNTDKFRLSKYFYENNILGNLIKMFL